VKNILVLLILVLPGCAAKQPDQPSVPQVQDTASVESQSPLDSLRAEVRMLSDIVRRMSVVDMPDEAVVCDERVPLERWWVRKKLAEWVAYYTNYPAGRRRIDLYLREAKYYFPSIEERLQAEGMPEDLKYIPVLESELNPTARSPKEAVGLWQIIPATGRERSLKINKYIDERQDFERATTAALSKLKQDYAALGNDWFLALAAYNAGLGRVKERLAKHGGERSYFNMVLPTETMAYGLRFVALKLVMEDPLRYGFDQEPADESRSTEVVSYTVKSTTTIIGLARALNVPAREFQLLNPQLVGLDVPPGHYRLRVRREPTANGEGIAALGGSDLAAIDSLRTTSPPLRDERRDQPKRGR
jgi:membrane-bound lytic murein transglycosylase D